MKNFSIEEQLELYELLISAMGSDNSDYITQQLCRIYKIIYSNNIDATEEKNLIIEN